MAGNMTLPASDEPVEYKLEGVETTYVSKPFFKEYYFKLIYDFSTKATNINGIAYASVQTLLSSRNIATNAAISILRSLPNVDFKHRVEHGGKLIMFLRSYGDFLLVAKHYPNNIISAVMPINDKQVEIMDEVGASTVFKHNLFKKYYRYKVSAKATDSFKKAFPAIHGINEVLNSIDFLPSHNYTLLANGERVDAWSLVTMYYNDASDIMMIRIILGSVEHTIEKCVLYSEIS
jgi:hypothetical protein